MRPPPSLYDLVGLSWSATEQEILLKYSDAVVHYGGPDRIPSHIERAFALLRDEGFRKNYSELWGACSRGDRVLVRPDERDRFERVCLEAGLFSEECSDAPGTFRLQFRR
jgi:hypothetical protein